MMFRRLLACLLLVVPLGTSAMTLETGEEHFLFEQKEDLYRFGSNVSLPSPFPGDALLLGETVTVDERVADDLIAAGKIVIINTTVGGNLRVAGETVIIRGIIEGSVIVAGSSITLQEGAQVKGDLTALGANVTLDGSVAGNVFVRGENVSMQTVKGNADIRGKSLTIDGVIGGDAILAGRILVGEGAKTEGNVRYWTPEGESLSTDFAGGDMQFDAALSPGMDTENDVAAAGVMALVLGAIGVFSILSAALVLVIAVPLMPRLPVESAAFLAKHPWQSLLSGLLFFVGLPVAAILLALSVFGLPLAAVTIMKFFSGLLLARVLAALVLVRFLQHRYKRFWNAWAVGALSLLCYAALKIVGIVPVVGFLASSVLVLLGFGALLAVSWQKLQKVL